MKKKLLSLLLALAICFSTIPSTVFAAEVNEVTITIHENYSSEGNRLTASQSTTFCDNSATISVLSDELSVSGNAGNTPYFVTVSKIGESVNASESTGNFTFVSFTAFDNFSRIVLTDNHVTNMVYIDISNTSKSLSALNYNPNWYASFFETVNVTNEVGIVPYGTGNNTQVYKAEYDVYGDTYTEKLSVGHSYQCPASITKGNSGDFRTSVNIEDRSTTIKFKNGQTQTLDTTNLYIRGCNIKVATAKGSYVSKLFYQHDALNCKDHTTSVAVKAGFSLSIPGTPLSINASITVTRTYGSNGEQGTIYYIEDNKGSQKLMVADVTFNSLYHISREDPSTKKPNGDAFIADWTVSTDSATATTGRHALTVRYSYILESTGTPTIISEDKTFNQTIYYMVN